MAVASVPRPTYPTQSTLFLDNLSKQQNCQKYSNDDVTGIYTNPIQATPTQAAVPLKIIIVGAGLGGLATAIALSRRGHEVIVLEQASKLREVGSLHLTQCTSLLTLICQIGAGIQIPSNSCRILLEWGLGPFLESKVVEPEGMTFRRWQNGKPIGFTKLVPDFRQTFNAPYYVVHRADFHDAMHKLAVKLGVKIEVASRVVRYSTENATVELQSGKEYSGDLVVAADGMPLDQKLLF